GPIIGWVAEHFGARAGLALGGVASLAAASAAAVTALKGRRQTPVAAGGGVDEPEAPLAPAPGGGIAPPDPVQAI
ncbi:MAG: MFS transporter, partial [Actinobacteria bacterium]|nr:MFS transporter [Actinomycetota bacterium]